MEPQVEPVDGQVSRCCRTSLVERAESGAEQQGRGLEHSLAEPQGSSEGAQLVKRWPPNPLHMITRSEDKP